MAVGALGGRLRSFFRKFRTDLMSNSDLRVMKTSISNYIVMKPTTKIVCAIRVPLVATAILAALSTVSRADLVLNFQTNGLSLTGGTYTDGPFGIANGATLTESGVTLTVEAIGSPHDSIQIGVNGNGGFAGDGDAATFGIGVRGNGTWAVNGNSSEALSLSFNSDVLINSIDLNGIGVAPNNNDRAIITIGTSVIDVFGASTVTGTPPVGTTFNGGAFDVINFSTPVALAGGETILLEGPNAGSGSFSLRGLTVTTSAVPEPSSFLMSGFLLVYCYVCSSRRRRFLV